MPSLRALPLFAELEPPRRRAVGDAASVREAAAGETVVEQWSHGRDFYVVLEGSGRGVDRRRDARHLGAGDFFGEIAALDWGAGFTYPRLAPRCGRPPLRLLVFPDGDADRARATLPRVERQMRAAVAERLPQHT